MGFFHVGDDRAIMHPSSWNARSYNAAEQYHAQLAYRIGRGFREYCGWPLRVACGDLPRRGAAPRTLILP